MHRVIEQPNTISKLHIIGNGHVRDLDYAIPDWGEEEKYFTYKGKVYFLSEFMRCEKRGPFAEFDGYHSDSFFSGILVKLDNDDGCADMGVKVYWYYC